MMKSYFPAYFLAILFSSLVSVTKADDVGITTARLIQLSDTSYHLEADATVQFVSMMTGIPVFPERFEVSKPEFTNKSGWIVVTTTAITSGDPLSPDEEILLPWLRNGVSLTVQWQDGTLNRGFYMRDLDGIHIPMSTLMPVDKTLWEVSGESFMLGLKHIRFGYIHLLMVLSLALLLTSKNLFRALTFYAFGQATSIVLIEFGITGFDLIFTDILIILLIFLVALCAVKKTAFKHLEWLLLLMGLLHGLSVGKQLSILNLPLEQKLPAAFMFNIAVDAVQISIAAIAALLIGFLRNRPKVLNIASYALGILSVVMILSIFNDRVFTGETDVLSLEENQQATKSSLPSPSAAQTAGNRPQGAKSLTSPIMSYLSVEPFEVRQEILVNARTALQLIDFEEQGMGSIQVNDQETIKQSVLELFGSGNPITIDGQKRIPVLTRIDFVTLGAGGVIIRPDPVEESMSEGILGVSMVYETETLADNISIDWEVFPEADQRVEATTIDPFGGASFAITPDENMITWKRTLSGYSVPTVEEIAIENPRLPVISALLVLLGIVLIIILKRDRRHLAIALLGLGLLLYPFVRFSLDVEFINRWKPSEERSTRILDGLLTNVYRSFDYRNEEAVYDRLSISVMGDQLTQTYIEQRKGLEIENRGGASAKVDAVDILEVHDVKSGSNNDFGIEVSWTINGSVSHFGHMHYRQNRYRAVIWIAPMEGSWKISGIEMIDEERLL
jgi:hypothetical protein